MRARDGAAWRGRDALGKSRDEERLRRGEARRVVDGLSVRPRTGEGGKEKREERERFD